MKRLFKTVEKKVYGKPMFQVIKVDSADIISTSPNGNTEELQDGGNLFPTY